MIDQKETEAREPGDAQSYDTQKTDPITTLQHRNPATLDSPGVSASTVFYVKHWLLLGHKGAQTTPSTDQLCALNDRTLPHLPVSSVQENNHYPERS